MPASTVHVRSPASCSSTRASPSVSSSWPILIRRPSRAASARSADASSSEAGRIRTLREPESLERVHAVRPRDLPAEPRRREHLAGVREPGGVERAAEPCKRLEVALGEHRGHRARLVDAHAVLAGERAAGLDAGGEDRVRQGLRALDLAVRGPVVENERMEVAVPGVEDVPDAEPVLGGERVDAAEDGRQPRARHHAVLDVVVGGDPAHRRERALAAEPEPRALFGVVRGADLEGARRAAERVDLLRVERDLRGTPSSSTRRTAPAPSG